ncbi:DUF397 domain-containing protein [Streptomyces tendae]|uniref:DUF397 domain-containing protein n=1 Tax=Streptomyces tendae TaxID=1932 RepID=UPI0036528F43
MNENPSISRPVTAGWYKSSYSAANNECIEVAHTVTQVGIRDSKLSGTWGFTVGSDAFALFIDNLRGASSSTPSCG